MLREFTSFIRNASTDSVVVLLLVVLSTVAYFMQEIIWGKPNPCRRPSERPQLSAGGTNIARKEVGNINEKLEKLVRTSQALVVSI